jgi:hypothetical protein
MRSASVVKLSVTHDVANAEISPRRVRAGLLRVHTRAKSRCWHRPIPRIRPQWKNLTQPGVTQIESAPDEDTEVDPPRAVAIPPGGRFRLRSRAPPLAASGPQVVQPYRQTLRGASSHAALRVPGDLDERLDCRDRSPDCPDDDLGRRGSDPRGISVSLGSEMTILRRQSHQRTNLLGERDGRLFCEHLLGERQTVVAASRPTAGQCHENSNPPRCEVLAAISPRAFSDR